MPHSPRKPWAGDRGGGGGASQSRAAGRRARCLLSDSLLTLETEWKETSSSPSASDPRFAATFLKEWKGAVPW